MTILCFNYQRVFVLFGLFTVNFTADMKSLISLNWLPFSQTMNWLVVALAFITICSVSYCLKLLIDEKLRSIRRKAEEDATRAYIERRDRFQRNTMHLVTNL